MISPVHLRDHIDVCPLQQMQCTTPGCAEVVRREQLHINGQNHQTLVREAASRDVREGHKDVATALAQILASSTSRKVHLPARKCCCQNFSVINRIYVPYNASTIKAMRNSHAVSHAAAVNQRLRLTQAAMNNQELSMRSDAVLKADVARAIAIDAQIAALQGQLNQTVAVDADTATYRHAAAVADLHAFQRNSRRPSVANVMGLREALEQQRVNQLRSRALQQSSVSVSIPIVAYSSVFTRNDSVSRTNNMSTGSESVGKLRGGVNTLKGSARTPGDTSSTRSINPGAPAMVRTWSCSEDGKGSLTQTLEESSLANDLTWGTKCQLNVDRCEW